jgi:hypothetical protein
MPVDEKKGDHDDHSRPEVVASSRHSPVPCCCWHATAGRPLCATEHWEIVKQLARQEEVACTTLEKILPISKSTISCHIKI